MSLNIKKLITLPSALLWLFILGPLLLSNISDVFIILGILIMMLWLLLLNYEFEKRIEYGKKLPKVITLYVKTTTIILPIFVLFKAYLFNWHTPRIILPIELFLTIGVFVTIYVVSRNLVVAERREVSDYATHIGTMFMVWILPIGIFFLQPRIRRCINIVKPISDR